jgi:cell division septum initiation protein DivIVA
VRPGDVSSKVDSDGLGEELEDDVDVQARLAELRRVIEEARSMPMSASAVVNRAELLGLVDEISAGLETAFADSARVVSERDAVVVGGREEADRIVADARSERDRLIEESHLHQDAQREAAKIVDRARAEADAVRRETDDYVDAKLAHFEITLERTSEAVRRGREQLTGTSVFGEITPDEVDRITLPDHLDG